MTPSILVLGNANVDLVLGEVDGWPAIGTEVMVDRSEMRAGGSAGNTALALAGLGVPHLFIASAGDDPNGEWLRGQFDPQWCDWVPQTGQTTVTVGIVHRGGDRAFFTTPGHLQTARAADLASRIPSAPNEHACAIISGGFLMPDILDQTSDLLALLKARGWRTAIDPGWPPQGWTEDTRGRTRRWIQRSDIILFNEDEVAGVLGQDRPSAGPLAADLRDGQILVVKEGAKGASAYVNGSRMEQQAPRVDVVDTVGAGDTFNAGFLTAMSRGAGCDEALALGIATAARAISTFPRRYS